MNQNEVIKIAEIVACPDCKQKLREITISQGLLGFFCESCGMIFPVEDDIPILLPIKARSYGLECSLVDNISQQAKNHSMTWLTEHADRTLNLLNQCKNKSIWEWEDEAHWSKVYAEESTAIVHKNWSDRLWQREFLVEHLTAQTSLKGKTILDVGCGEGQNFRMLMAQYCDEATLYIGADISLAGLRLNRLRNTHKNSLYILCSADSLPIQKETIDVLCYFGILHHTEIKTGAIPKDGELLRSDGYILIHEPLSRVSPSLLLGFLKSKSEQSAHEEHIDREKLTSAISESNLKIMAAKAFNTIFLTGMMELFTNFMINNKTFFTLISNLDSILMKMFGGVIPYFRAGSIMLLLRKS